MFFDMADIILMVRPTRAVTFAEYVSLNIVPFLKNQLTSTVERVDAIWDTYPEKNLKSLTQKRRGTGVRTRLEPNSDGSTPIPKRDWQSYLKNVDNKRELFFFISKQMAGTELGDKLILTTDSEMVLTNRLQTIDMKTLEPCNHTEADTRIFLHLAHAASQGHKKAFVRQ